MCRFEGVATLIVLALAVSCNGEESRTAPVYTARFIASNDLLAPITIHVDGVPNVILDHGSTATITASSTSRVTWTSAKPADAFGNAIPDEIGENEIIFAGTNQILEITNIINDQPYFTASIHNYTSTTVSIGISDGSTVACAAVLPSASTTAAGFVQTGYYRITPRTELRAYLNPAACTGSFVTWPASELAAYAPKSGLLRVSLTSGP